MTWRQIVFVLVMIGVQGLFGVVLPTSVSPPDLFLLVALNLSARVPLFWGLVVGYGIGLLQDILGAGMLGFHAAGLMTGVLVSSVARRGLNAEPNINNATAALLAMMAKWFVFIALNYWTRQNAITVETLLYRFLPEVVMTLLVSAVVFRFANWAFGHVNEQSERLL
jgi:rod shape-determining protein MreD